MNCNISHVIMCDRDLHIRVARLGNNNFPLGNKYVTVRVNEWDPVSKVFSLLGECYDVKYGSLKYLGVEIPKFGSYLRLYDIAAAFNGDFVRLSVELDEEWWVAVANAHPGFMILNVMTLTGESLHITADSTHTVDTIKSTIQRKEGISPDQQLLVFAGQLLENGRTLAYYNIQSKATLYLVFKQREGVSLLAEPSSQGWRAACYGLNLEGICPNPDCAAFNCMVICKVGFGVTNVCRAKCKCPACNSAFAAKACGFARCDWLRDGIIADGTPANLAWKTAGDEYQRFNIEAITCKWEVMTIVCRHHEPAYQLNPRLRTATGVCVVCTERDTDTTLVPCEHTLCPVCAFKVHDCPHCRAPIVMRQPA